MKKNHQLIQRLKVVELMGVLTLVFALAMPDRLTLLTDYWRIITQPSHLITDIFAAGSLAAGFFNASLHFFVASYLMGRNERSNINGLQMAVLGIFIGHSFFGTNIFNIVPLVSGVFLYAKWTHQSFKLYTTISLFATSLSPVVSYLAFGQGLTPLSLVLGCLVGVFLGFIAPPLAEEFLKFHHGLTLYNFGFTTGIIGMFLVLFLPYFNLQDLARESQLSSGAQVYILGYIGLMLLVPALLVLKNHRAALSRYPDLLKSSGRVPDDFVSKYGIYTALLNMMVTASVFLLILLVLGVELTGPMLGGLATVFGFGAFGKHLRNALPVALGVGLATILVGNSLSEHRFGLTMLFATGLSPIAGYHGTIYGIIAGFLHYNLAAVVLPLHQGLSLYNNGFSTGFVAAFMTPLIGTFEEYKRTWFRKKD